MRGTVKNYFPDRGFGFIRSDGGEDVFVHATVLKRCGLASLEAGQTVEFEKARAADGRERAVSVTVVADPAKRRLFEAASCLVRLLAIAAIGVAVSFHAEASASRKAATHARDRQLNVIVSPNIIAEPNVLVGAPPPAAPAKKHAAHQPKAKP